jgi:hypothetical protein
MRRSPKALDRDRQLERLIAQANGANERRAKRRTNRFEKVLFDGGPAPEATTPHLGDVRDFESRCQLRHWLRPDHLEKAFTAKFALRCHHTPVARSRAALARDTDAGTAENRAPL